MNEKAELLTSLKWLYAGLQKIEEISSHKESLVASVENYRQAIQNEQRKGQTNAALSGVVQKGASVGKVVGIIAVIIVSYLLCGIVMLITALILPAEIANVVGTIEGFIFFAIAVGLIFLIVKGTGAIKNSSVKNVGNTANNTKNNIANYQNQIYDIQTRQIPEAEARLIIAYQDAQALIEVFPPDYCYSYAVGRVISFIENQRADTIKEALNLYENEVYQNKMLAEQQRQTKAAELSAKANVISAAANVVTAFNTGQIASNTSQMVGTLRNIENYSAQTAANTAATAANTATTAYNSGKIADFAQNIAASLR